MFKKLRKWIPGLGQLGPDDKVLPPVPKWAVVGEPVDHMTGHIVAPQPSTQQQDWKPTPPKYTDGSPPPAPPGKSDKPIILNHEGGRWPHVTNPAELPPGWEDFDRNNQGY